jgi:hypothetical protein
MISHSLDIAAPPEIVRQILLDFANLSQWHTHFIHSIKILQPPNTSSGLDLKPGDRMQTHVAGMVIEQTVQENTPSTFKTIGPWKGNPREGCWRKDLIFYGGVLTGHHTYHFARSDVGTTFTNEEEFSVSNLLVAETGTHRFA